MVDANMITGLLSNAKLSTAEITKMVGEKSPLPVPEPVVQGLLDQLVGQGKIKKSEENGTVYYHL